MTAASYAVSDTLVLALRNLKRIPRAPDLLLSFTLQPVMFVLLFTYVFGGAIATPGHTYVDFLIPGLIAQTMFFGGFVTAVGLRRPEEGADRPLPGRCRCHGRRCSPAARSPTSRPTCSRWR